MDLIEKKLELIQNYILIKMRQCVIQGVPKNMGIQ